ncbi:MAG TPA: prepilin peptidase [Candidatus Nanoarchaeia archaeon]|nr:prepilin peptidase [Candidatus Nanoarchaeia archaeon]
MLEIIFLFALALVWIVFAVMQDLKTREIANWLNFSLIIFALGFRFFYSLFSAGNFNFFYQGLFGLGIFFVLGNLLYYGKMFAGGDAKLLIALGAVLPVSESFYDNLEIFLLFFVAFLFVGAFYSIAVSLRLCIRNYGKFKKEFARQFKVNRRAFILSLIFSITFVILGYLNFYLIFIAILIFIFPYLYIYAKAVDETAMIKTMDSKKLREGDWLYRDVKVKGRTIKASWDGLKKQEISILRKSHKKVLIREGVAFTPVFLIGFLIWFYLWYNGLRYPFW